MRFVLATLAVLLGVAMMAPAVPTIEAASNATCVGKTIECPPFTTANVQDYDIGQVIGLRVSSGIRYEVQVLTTGDNFTVSVSKDLFDQLAIGDTVSVSSDELRLVHTGRDQGRGTDRK
jgi:hypothetical protein